MKYKVVNAMDVPWENLSKHFDSCSKFIKQAVIAGGKVLIHCYAGVSRSAAICVAYLMKEHNMNMFYALSLVKSKRN